MFDVAQAPQEPEPRQGTTAAEGPELGPGRPLGAAQRHPAETAYRTALGGVTVHTGPEADAFVRGRSRAAAAATVGTRVAFAHGRYRPGTLTGDAILAHELAHVVQQGGSGSYGSDVLEAGPPHEEDGADRAAASLLLSTHARGHRHEAALRDLLGPDQPPARTGGRPRVQTCLCVEPAEMSDVTVDLEIPDSVETVMDELEGLEAPYEAIRERGAVTRRGANLAAAGRGSPGALGAGLGSIPATNEAFRKANEAAAVEGTTVADIEAKAAVFSKAFRDHAVNVAYSILESNEKLVQGEHDRYSGSPDAGGVAELWAAVAPYKAKLEQAKADRKYAEGTKAGGQEGRGAVVWIKPPDAKAKLTAAGAAEDEVREALTPRFPTLADPDFPILQLVNTPGAVQSSLQRTTGNVLENIHHSRGALKEDPDLVWQFDQAVAAARVSMDVVPGSVFDLIIEETIERRQREEFFENLLLGAMAIGLGLLSFGGGTVAVLAAIGEPPSVPALPTPTSRSTSPKRRRRAAPWTAPRPCRPRSPACSGSPSTSWPPASTWVWPRRRSRRWARPPRACRPAPRPWPS